jgi:hypothetical protein
MISITSSSFTTSTYRKLPPLMIEVSPLSTRDQ